MVHVAISGIECRLRSAAGSADQLWDLLRWRDGIIDIRADRWSFERSKVPDRDVSGRTYTSSGGFLQDSLWEFDRSSSVSRSAKPQPPKNHRRLGDLDDHWSPDCASAPSTWQRDDRALQQGGPAADLPSVRCPIAKIRPPQPGGDRTRGVR